MRAIFAHDNRFVEAGGKVWSEGPFEARLWSRYLIWFDELTVVGRRGTVWKGKTIEDFQLASAPGVQFEFLPDLSSVRALVWLRRVALKRLRELVRRHDAVIARLPSEIGRLALTAAKLEKKPAAVELVGCAWDALWNYGTLQGKLYAPIAWLLTRKKISSAKHVLYVSSAFLQKRYPSKAENQVAVSNVILSDVAHEALDARLERIASLDRRPVRLGMIGSLLARYKGIQTVLAALSQSRGDLGPATFHVLGPGDPTRWRAEARRLGVSDIVFFEGTLPAGEPVLKWLDGIDLYLQPSLQEGLPRALIEAMSRACPALASTAGGIPELLPAEDLIPPGDVRALVTLLRRRVRDREWMMVRAKQNWLRAHDYRADVTDARRATFWSAFVEAIGSRPSTSRD